MIQFYRRDMIYRILKIFNADYRQRDKKDNSKTDLTARECTAFFEPETSKTLVNHRQAAKTVCGFYCTKRISFCRLLFCFSEETLNKSVLFRLTQF